MSRLQIAGFFLSMLILAAAAGTIAALLTQ